MALPITEIKGLDYGFGISYSNTSTHSLDFYLPFTCSINAADTYSRKGPDFIMMPRFRVFPPFPANRQYPIY